MRGMICVMTMVMMGGCAGTEKESVMLPRGGGFDPATVEAARVRAREAWPAGDVTLVVKENGAVEVAGRQMERKEFLAALERAMKEDPSRKVKLIAGENVQMAAVSEVIAACTQAGVKDLHFQREEAAKK